MLGGWTQSVAHAKQELYHWVTLSAPKLHCSTFSQRGVKRTTLSEPITNFTAHFLNLLTGLYLAQNGYSSYSPQLTRIRENHPTMVFQFTSHKAPSSEALPRKSEIQVQQMWLFKKKKKAWVHLQTRNSHSSFFPSLWKSSDRGVMYTVQNWNAGTWPLSLSNLTAKLHKAESETSKEDCNPRRSLTDTATERERLWPYELPLCALWQTG